MAVVVGLLIIRRMLKPVCNGTSEVSQQSPSSLGTPSTRFLQGAEQDNEISVKLVTWKLLTKFLSPHCLLAAAAYIRVRLTGLVESFEYSMSD
jgi:hypothetical protein